MRREIRCHVCNKKFTASRENQRFCSRDCFRIDYYDRVKKANALSRFPTYRCQSCGEMIKLDFKPTKNIRQWKKFKCPKCKTKVQSVIDEAMEEDFPLLT